MKRAAAVTPSPSQSATANEPWATVELKMSADSSQTIPLSEDKACAPPPLSTSASQT